MNEKRASGMILLTAVLWMVVVAAVVIMCSCTGKKVVTEYVTVHDTLMVTHSDTIVRDRIVVKRDTLREVTVREVTLMRDTAGHTDTIRIETVSDHYRYVYEGDSSSVYRNGIDSILKVLDKQREKSTVKTKPLIPWWQYGIAILIIGGFCVWVLKSRMF